MMQPTRALALAPLALVMATASLSAQRQFDQAAMKAQYEEMFAHDWYTGSAWTVDFAAAKAKAKATGKPIFAYFTRTYAP